MGAGHDQVAEELARRLAGRGFRADIVDMWDVLPLRLGRAITGFYRFMIHRSPWLYETVYRMFLRPRPGEGAPSSPVTWIVERRVAAWVAARHPAVAVSTFHLASQVLGGLRRHGRLSSPAATLVVDFATHGSWVDPDIDVNLCLHPVQVPLIESQGGRGAEAVGPVVRPRFLGPVPDRRTARARLGLPFDERVALVVAGSWGAGDINSTVTAISSTGFHALVVCGRNERLRARLARRPDTTVLGWVDDMEQVMAAADVVVENAGGLTAMEAMAVGVPVVSFAPIPGHGKDNVALMAEAGISVYAHDADELANALRALADGPQRQRHAEPGRAMFVADAAERIASLAAHDGVVVDMAAADASEEAGERTAQAGSAARAVRRLAGRLRRAG